MVHTLEIVRHCINDNERNQFIRDKYTQYDKNSNENINYSLKDKGIIVSLKEIKNTIPDIKENKTYYERYMTIRLNPSKMLDKTVIDILTFCETNSFINMFNYYISKYFNYLPDFSYWNIKRIDYCINVFTEYQDLYITLARKCNQNNFIAKYDQKSHRRVQKKGSLWLMSNTKKPTLILNIYDKGLEVETKQNVKLTDLDFNIPEDQGILRLEIQCLQGKVSQIKNKYHLESKQAINFLNVEIMQNEMFSIFKKIFGIGNYYKYSIAKNLILNSNLQLGTIENMLAILDTLKIQHMTYDKCKDKLISENIMSESKFNYCIKTLNEKLNINPCTIPDKTAQTLKINKLLSLPKLFDISVEDLFCDEYLKRYDFTDTNYYDLISQPW